MEALTSPVKAPSGAVWQFWAPSWAGAPVNARLREDIKGKGGQMITRLGVVARLGSKEGMNVLIKAREPFIFQLATIIFPIYFLLIHQVTVPKTIAFAHIIY
jgi:hypothetical protein